MPFLVTSTHRQIADTLAFCAERRATGTVQGPAGIGKSTSIRHIARSDQNAVLVEYMPRFRTVKGLHTAFLEACGFPQHYRSHYELEKVAEEEAQSLARHGHYLIVDEFQQCDCEAIRALLRFNDDYALPIILVGNLSRMRKKRSDTLTHEQISSRIWKTLVLPDPVPDDFRLFADHYGVEGKDAFSVLLDIGLKTELRHVVHLLETARSSADDRPLRAADLLAAESYLTGGLRKRA